MQRLVTFLNPYADPEGAGYHMIQSMVAVANGEVAGRGLGHGLQKFGYLPEDRTDFLFAIICEELGVAGALVVVALYGGMLWSCWTIIRREQAAILKLLALGVVATVGIQALINLAVVTGLGPTKGIALPLLSSGGTGWILTAASLGLIVAMDRTQDGWSPVARIARSPVSSRPLETEPVLAAPDEALAALSPAADDHSRWAPPGLFAGMATPVSETEPLSPETPATAQSVEMADWPTDGEQGLLFSEPVAQTSSPDTLAALEDLEVESTEEGAAAQHLSEQDAFDSAEIVSIVEPSGITGETGMVETITTLEGPTEQLVITLDDAVPALQPEPAAPPQNHDLISQHI
jgi:hypothetical protein